MSSTFCCWYSFLNEIFMKYLFDMYLDKIVDVILPPFSLLHCHSGSLSLMVLLSFSLSVLFIVCVCIYSSAKWMFWRAFGTKDGNWKQESECNDLRSNWMKKKICIKHSIQVKLCVRSVFGCWVTVSRFHSLSLSPCEGVFHVSFRMCHQVTRHK